jgi:TonB family protein
MNSRIYSLMYLVVMTTILFAQENDEIELAEDSAATATDSLPPIQKMPELITFVEAAYPDSLVKRGIEGVVAMDLVVSDSGKVDSVAIINGVHPVLDRNAAAAARQFAFKPAIAADEPVTVLLRYEYRFSLSKAADRINRYVNFSGRLVEKGTKRPIPDALVVVSFPDTVSDTALAVPFSRYLETVGRFEGQYREENKLVAVTDSQGKFIFYSLPCCSISVALPLPGYETFVERELILPGDHLTATYYPRKISYSDYEIVVYGQSEKKEVSRQQITMAEIKTIPGVGGDAVKVVQTMPGVSRPVMGSGEMVVRGAQSWDSNYLLNGQPIPSVYHFGGLKSVYNADALESVDFYPGGWGTRYGWSIAGIIELKGRKAKDDRWQGYVDLNALDATAFVEGPVVKNVSVLASARRSHFGELLNWGIDNMDLDLPLSIQPYYWDFLVRTDYTPSKNHTFNLTTLGSWDRMDLIFSDARGGDEEAGGETDRIKQTLGFYQASLGWNWHINEQLTNELIYGAVDANGKFNIFGYTMVEQHFFAHHLRNEFSSKINDVLNITAGADMLVLPMDLVLHIQDGLGFTQKDTLHNMWYGDLAAYLFCEWKPLPGLQLIPGLRYDYYPELIHDGPIFPQFRQGKSPDSNLLSGVSGEPSFRMNGRYEVRDGHTIKAAIGNYSNTPEPMGQTIHETWGVPSLPAERATQYVAGYEWRITDLIHADIQTYVNLQWNIPRQADTNDLTTGKTDLWYSDELGRTRGIELMLRHDRGQRFYGWLSYALARSERKSPYDSDYRIFDQDETHNIQLVGSWRFPRDLETGFRLRYVTGKPTTPVRGSTYYEYYHAYVPDYAQKNSDRMGPFVQLDLRFDKRFVYKRYILQTYADLQNVSWFFYKSPEFYQYNFDYTDRQPVSNIFIPSIGCRLEF